MAKDKSAASELAMIQHSNEQEAARIREMIGGMSKTHYKELRAELSKLPPLEFPLDMIFLLARQKFNEYIEERTSFDLYGLRD
jgi:hypothetical protein